MVDRLLPSDIESEEALLGSILIGGKSIARMSSNLLSAKDFYSERNQWIFQACMNVYSKMVEPDQITVAQELDSTDKLERCGGVAFLSHLISVVPTTLDAPYYAEIVGKLSNKRKLIALSEQVALLGYEGNTEIDKLIEKVDGLWSEFKRHSTVSTKVITPKMAGNDLMTMAEQYSEPAHFPSWGFLALDEITAGIAPEYTLIGARPSVGKTQLIVDTAENVSNEGKYVMLASAEMQNSQLYERRISRHIGLSILQLRKYGLNDDQKAQLYDVAGMIADSKLHYFSGKLSFKEIYREAYHWREQGKLDVLFIDYIGALQDCYEENRDSQSTRISRVSNKIQAMTHELGIPVVVASQLNRELEHSGGTFKGQARSRKPQLSDLRDSGSLEQDADVVFLLHRELAHPEVETSDELSPVLQIKMAKNRQLGIAKAVELLYNHNLKRYVDVTNRQS